MNGLSDLLAIAAGGSLGAVLRHLLTVASTTWAGAHAAIGTTIANLLGCFVIGFLIVLAGDGSPSWWSDRMSLAARVGMIGSLTTFSTFIAESMAFMGQARYGAAGMYIGANLLLGALVLWLAMRWGRMVIGIA